LDRTAVERRARIPNTGVFAEELRIIHTYGFFNFVRKVQILFFVDKGEMSVSYETILHEAEQLPLEEQRALVAELSSHFPEEEEQLLTLEQQAELNRRIKLHEDGQGEYFSWDEAKDHILKKLG
jgi:putative addiction module component (TIGR02574 family)